VTIVECAPVRTGKGTSFTRAVRSSTKARFCG